MSGRANVALEVGTAVTRLAVDGPDAGIAERPTREAGLPAFLRSMLEDAWGQAPGEGGSVTVVAHESWYDGSVAGARAQHRIRTALGELGTIWISHVTAAAALAAAESQFRLSGPYLVCDAGASGVTVARCEVVGTAVELRAVSCDRRHGGAAFAQAVAALHEAAVAEDVPRLMREQRSRSTAEKLRRARSGDEAFLAAPVYRSEQLGREYALTAGELLRCFEPVADRLGAAITEVMAGEPPVAAVLAGGFSEFPLFEQTVGELTGREPRTLGGGATVTGGLLVAAGTARVTQPDVPEVSVAVHRVHNGLLESHQVPLNPRSAPFALLRGEPLQVRVDAEEFHVEVNGRPRRVAPPRLAPGDYEIGLRPCRSGPGIMVFQTVSDGVPTFLPLSTESSTDDR